MYAGFLQHSLAQIKLWKGERGKCLKIPYRKVVGLPEINWNFYFRTKKKQNNTNFSELKFKNK